jgi:hypothetical protein
MENTTSHRHYNFKGLAFRPFRPQVVQPFINGHSHSLLLLDRNPVASKEFCQVAVLRCAPSNFVDIHLFLCVSCNGEIPVANLSYRKSQTAPCVWLINCTFLRDSVGSLTSHNPIGLQGLLRG